MSNKLTTDERDEMKNAEFGIPSKRAFPLNDESHVRAAVRMFPFADDSDKRELARNILKRAKHFNIDTSKWESLKPYMEMVDDKTSGSSDFDNEDDDNEPDDCYVESIKQEAYDAITDKEIPINHAYTMEEMVARSFTIKELTLSDPDKLLSWAKDIANKIHAKYESDKKEPTGNQNCQLCTWCAEAQFRDHDILPRPIYSPRDPAFDIEGETIVKNSTRLKPTSFDNLLEILSVETPFGRWYCHVKWSEGNGGHEFLILKIHNKYFTMDPQQGSIEPLHDTNKYVEDIDWDETFICRFDDKEFDYTLLEKINDPSKIVQWDESKDIPYMRDHDMLPDEPVKESFNNMFGDTTSYIYYDETYEPYDEYYGEADQALMNQIQKKENNIPLFQLRTYAKKHLSKRQVGSGIELIFRIGREYTGNNSVEKRCHEYFLNLLYEIDKCIEKSEDKISAVKKPKWFFYERKMKQLFNLLDLDYVKDRVLSYIAYDRGIISFKEKESIKYAYDPNTDILIHRSSRPNINRLIPSHESRDGIVYPRPRIYCYLEQRKNFRLDAQDSEQYGDNVYEIVIPNSITVFRDMEYGKPHDNSKYGKEVFINTNSPLKAKSITSDNTGDQTNQQQTESQNMSSPSPIKESFNDMLPDESTQESFQDVKNGINPFNKNLVFHISKEGHLDGRVFKPRVPEYLDKYDPTQPNFEDVESPRTCFSPSIEGCLNAILVNIGRWKTADKLGDWYVYIPEKPLKEYQHKTTKELIKEKKVYDANITDEVWITEPVRLKQYGIIHVDQVNNVVKKKTVPMLNGKSGERNKYNIKWHWLVKPKVLKNVPYIYTAKSVCEDMLMDMSEFKYGLPYGGKIISGSSEDFDKKYKLQSPDEFEKTGGGICYDFVEWQERYLDWYGHTCTKYFISTDTKDNDTHTFMLIEDGNGGFVYPEVAFGIMKGVHLVKSLEEALQLITKNMFKINGNDKKYTEIKYYVWKYVGHPKYGSNMIECHKFFTRGEPIYEGVAKYEKHAPIQEFVTEFRKQQRYIGGIYNG